MTPIERSRSRLDLLAESLRRSNSDEHPPNVVATVCESLAREADRLAAAYTAEGTR